MSDNPHRITVHAQTQTGFLADRFTEESAQTELLATIAGGEIALDTGVGPVDPHVEVVLREDGLSVSLARGEEVLDEYWVTWAEVGPVCSLPADGERRITLEC